MNPVLTGYFLGMPYSKSNLALKLKVKRQRQQRLKIRRPRFYDKNTRILTSKCDLCNDQLPKEADNIQYRINILDEIDNSYESEYDKHEPRLLLCSFCSREYMIPTYTDP